MGFVGLFSETFFLMLFLSVVVTEWTMSLKKKLF